MKAKGTTAQLGSQLRHTIKMITNKSTRAIQKPMVTRTQAGFHLVIPSSLIPFSCSRVEARSETLPREDTQPQWLQWDDSCSQVFSGAGPEENNSSHFPAGIRLGLETSNSKTPGAVQAERSPKCSGYQEFRPGSCSQRIESIHKYQLLTQMHPRELSVRASLSIAEITEQP